MEQLKLFFGGENMIPVEELYEVLSKSRDLIYAEKDKDVCSFCNRDRYDWHNADCPVSRLYIAISDYDDAKNKKLPTW